MKKEMVIISGIVLCAFWSTACSPASNFVGETYAGKILINGVEPNDKSIEKFQLSESKLPDGKKQKFVTLATENKIIGDCTIPLKDDIQMSSPKQIGKYFVPEKSGAACTSKIDGRVAKFVVHSGSVSPNVDESKNDVRFQMIAVNTIDSKSYEFEINAERE